MGKASRERMTGLTSEHRMQSAKDKVAEKEPKRKYLSGTEIASLLEQLSELRIIQRKPTKH